MGINYLELINAIKKAKKEDEKANIWRRVFWNTPNPYERGCKNDKKSV